MIVEFIGSTGAGKTTLIAEVQRALAPHAGATTSFELAAGMLRLRHVANPTLRNLIQDFVGLPFFVASFRRHRGFIAFALATLVRNGIRGFYRFNYMRSLIRKIGMYEVARRYGGDRIILVDEGTVSAAHLLFIFTPATSRSEDIDKFAGLVSLPDLLVYVKTPVDRLVERSLQRQDRRRELKSADTRQVEQYVSRATAMFDRLADTQELRDRLLIVGTTDSADSGPDAAADHTVNFLRRRYARPVEVPSVLGEPV